MCRAGIFGSAAAGIVLSGTGHDGVQGARALKAGNGLVLIQDPADAGYAGMPTAILNTGLADVVAPASELGAELAEIIQLGAKASSLGRQHSHDTLRALTQALLRKTGFAFEQYKDSTLHRRIERRMTVDRDQFRAEASPKLVHEQERLERLQTRQLDFLGEIFLNKVDELSLSKRQKRERHVRTLN